MAPPRLAESWDNPGLQVGDPAARISRIMVSLDATPSVMAASREAGCDLLVTHHPLIFTPQKSLSAATPLGAMIQTAIRNNLAVVSMHTNYDCAEGGLNDLLAERIGLAGCGPLQVTSRAELAKLAVYVPAEQLEAVRSALLPHAEPLGSYAGCSFSASGEGTFTPLEGATPFIGTVGSQELVTECRLELLVDRARIPRVVKALLAAHPYEEPAFDLYPLLNEGRPSGLGRIGQLPSPLPLVELADRLRRELDAPGLRFVGAPDARISRVALCSGSGASLLRTAHRAGAQVLVTGDVKYHEAREAEELGLSLIDAGHFPTEIIMVADVARRLEEQLDQAGYGECRVVPCRLERDPFKIL